MVESFPRPGEGDLGARRRRGRLVAVLASLIVGAAATTLAAEPPTEDRARAIFHEYLSPFCPGLLLSDCSSRPAETLRTEIRTALANGVSDAEVRADLQRRFGERILAAPRTRGFGLIAWLVPPVVVTGAVLAVVLWWLGRTRMPPAPRTPSALSGDPLLRARLDAELRSF